jgi:hypothetical protein
MPRKAPLTLEQIEKQRAASLRWYHANKERVSAAHKTDEHRAKQREWNRRYAEKHRAELAAAAREYKRRKRAENPEAYDEASRIACKASRERHGDKWNATRNAKRARKPQKWRDADNARRSEAWHSSDPVERAIAGRIRRIAIREEAPWRLLLRSAQARARKYGLPFSLTEEWATSRWTGRCEVTDIPFVIRVADAPGPRVYSASIDQIAPKVGYTPGNCRFVLWAVNALKHNGTDEDMLIIAKAIVDKSLISQ